MTTLDNVPAGPRSSARPLLVQGLAQFCRQHLLEEKWLLAPSLRVGHQWVEQVVRGGVPIINLHVNTIRRLARDLCEAAMGGGEFLSARGSAVCIDRLISRLKAAGSSYLATLRPGVSLSKIFADSLGALRLAGLAEDQLCIDFFEQPGKAAELRRLLTAFRIKLESRGQIDDARALQIATQAIRSPPTLLAEGVLILVADDLSLNSLEHAFLAALPDGVLRWLPVDQPAPALQTRPATDASRLSWLAAPAEAPPPVGDDSAEIFRAVGETNEVREVLRRCLSRDWRLDEVELLHTDTDTYVPLVYELLARHRDDGADDTNLSVTFAEGLPVRYARPGRALTLWLQWAGDGFSQDVLVRMLQDGLLNVQHHPAESLSNNRLAAWLRAVPIGFGRDRYLMMIDEQASALTLPDPPDREEAEATPASSRRQDAVAAQRRGLQVLRGLCEALLGLAPPPGADALTVLQAAARFLETHARAITELDRNARLRLLGEIRDMVHWILQDDEPISFDMREWLAALPAECRVLGSGPRPGCLHVAHVGSGGHSGRPHLFIVGMDDSRFPGALMQDPLLLDSERRRISPELATAAGQLRQKIDAFARLLARQRGTVTLSFSCNNLLDDSEMFPSPVVLGAYRVLSGNAAGDQSDLLAWLGSPSSFAPLEPKNSLDETEWWLWRLCGNEEVAEAHVVVGRHFPHLARGHQAAECRAGVSFTAFDGFVPQAGHENDPLASNGPVMSSRRLETLGRCPRAYFFQFLLHIEPPEELIIDPSRWLDPLALGALLHEVFEEFLTRLIGEDRTPEFARDWPQLVALLDARVQVYRHRFPPAHESVFRQQCRQLQQAAAIFLHEEEEYGRDGKKRPMCLEAAIGIPRSAPGTALDCPEPVIICLPGGQQMRARALMDRLDRVVGDGEPEFYIWDYKTGSTWKYRQPDPFHQGRVIQNGLYMLIATARLRQAVSASARVTQFGFFFPGVRGRGERIIWAPQNLTGAERVILDLCRIAGQGAFLATTDHEKDCTYCHYRPICGDVEAAAATSQLKLANPANTVLQPFLRLRTDR